MIFNKRGTLIIDEEGKITLNGYVFDKEDTIRQAIEEARNTLNKYLMENL